MNMKARSLVVSAVLAVSAVGLSTVSIAEEVVEMSGISIIGNRELPKTLFIVPWKNSEVNVETDLTNTLNEGLQPLDQEVFKRELEYYDFSHSSN